MIKDARGIDVTALDADVVIIGTGPAGLAVGLPLLGSSRKVVFLEAGGDKPDLDLQEPFWSAGEEISGTHPPLYLYRRRAFGGTSTVWGGRCLPLDPIDFRPVAGARPDSWPIDYDEVSAYYPAALHFLDAGAYEFDAETAFRDPRGLLANGQLDRIERFSLPTDVGRKFRKELARDENSLVLLNAPCVEILTEVAGVSGARCRIGSRDLIVRSRTVVLANGGLECARLLLASNAQRPTGLGNERDLVGRYYMCQLSGNCGRLSFRDSAIERAFGLRRTHDGVYGQRLINLPDSLREGSGLLNFVLRPSVADAANPRHDNAALSTYYVARRFLGSPENRRRYELPVDRSEAPNGHAANILWHLPSAIAFAARWTAGKRIARRRVPILSVPRESSNYPLEFNSEQSPNPESRVLLSTSRDPIGMPLLNVRWRISDVDRDTILKGYELASQTLAPAGRMSLDYDLDELRHAVERVAPCGGHHIGTTRMGATPAAGVVGPDCQLWDTKGVYVAGSAVFPVAGYANPTLTVVALALRLADHLKGVSPAT